MISVIIPVYKNAEFIPEIIARLKEFASQRVEELEAVFVVDGSPDNSYKLLREALPKSGLHSQLLLLSRNFGSFQAIRAGLEVAKGDFCAVMSADLQEPIELLYEFCSALKTRNVDVVLASREGRDDPILSRLASAAFWSLYRRLVMPEIPSGGVDMFACTRKVKDQICALRERNSSLVGLLFWVGFQREFVPYRRLERKYGKSAWSFKRKVEYLFDSIFSFSDLPIRLLSRFGFIAMGLTLIGGATVVLARILGLIHVPGYAALILTVMFFGALNCMALGIIGGYVWRTFENSKARPNFIVSFKENFSGEITHLEAVNER